MELKLKLEKEIDVQQELIEMLEEIIQYVEVWNAHDQGIIDKAEALVEKAKNGAKESASPQGEPVAFAWRAKKGQPSAWQVCFDLKQAADAEVLAKTEIRFMSWTTPVAPSQPVRGVPDVATWLWLRFADYCRKQGMNPHHQNDLFAIVNELRAMLASTTPPVQAPSQPVTLTDEWVSVGDQKPPTNKPVLLHYLDEHQRSKIVRAHYIPAKTVEAGEDDAAEEYDAESDTYFVQEGWYEDNSESEVNYGITGQITHWRNLPLVPAIIAAMREKQGSA